MKKDIIKFLLCAFVMSMIFAACSSSKHSIDASKGSETTYNSRL